MSNGQQMFGNLSLSCMVVLAFAIVLANYRTAKLIWSTFSMKRAVFFLAFVDASIEAFLGVVTLVAALSIYVYPMSLASCTMIHTVLMMFRICGQVPTVEIASIRLHVVLNSKKQNPVSESKAIKISLMVLFMSVCFWFAFIFANLMSDCAYAIHVQECIGDLEKSPAIGNLVFIGVSVNALPLMSLVLSSAIIISIKRNLATVGDPSTPDQNAATTGSNSTERVKIPKLIHTVPVMSLVLSALLSLMPILVITLVMLTGIIVQPAASVVTTHFVLLMALLRCPITTKLTLKAKAKRDLDDKITRQQREREHAAREREARQAGFRDQSSIVSAARN